MSNLVARVQNILLTPKTEWPVIAAEPETTSGLYTKYILIVSAVAAIAMFVKASLIGTSTFIGTYRMDMGTGIGYAVTLYVAGLVGIYLWSLDHQRPRADFRRPEGFRAGPEDGGLRGDRRLGRKHRDSSCPGSAG